MVGRIGRIGRMIGRVGALAPSQGVGFPYIAPGQTNAVIWDTDLDSDCDDVSGLALLLAMCANAGLNLLACTVASNNDYSAPAMRALLDYAGKPNTIVGAYKGSSILGGNASFYDQALRDQFRPGDDRSRYQSAVSTLRYVLSRCADGGARLIAGGTLTNISALLQSAPDQYSALTGSQLVAAKVSAIYSMGGNFVSSTTSENNIALDIAAANYVAANSPVPVIWAGYEVGNSISTLVPESASPTLNPFKIAWDLSSSQLTAGRRQSWDLAAVYYGILQDTDGAFSKSSPGDVSFDGNSYTTFTLNGSGKNRYVTKVLTDVQIRDIMDDLICTAVSSAEYLHTGLPGAKLAEWLMSEGTGTTVADQTSNDFDLTLGLSGSGLPAWADIDPGAGQQWALDGATGQGAFAAPSVAGLSLASFTLAALIYLDTTTGIQQILAKTSPTQSNFQFRNNAGQIEFVGYGTTSVMQFGAASIASGQWVRLVCEVVGRRVRVYKNGAQISTDKTLTSIVPNTALAQLGVLARVGGAGTITDGMDGRCAYAAVFKPGTPPADIDGRIQSVASAKGITF